MKTLLLLLLLPRAGSGQNLPAAKPAGYYSSIVAAMPPRSLFDHGGIDLGEECVRGAVIRLLEFHGGEFSDGISVLNGLNRAASLFLKQVRSSPPGADTAGLEALGSDLILIENLFSPLLRENLNKAVLGLRRVDPGAEMWTPERKDEIRRKFFEAVGLSEKTVLAEIMLDKNFGLRTPLDALKFLHPEEAEEIEDFYDPPNLFSAGGLASSALADRGQAVDWARNVRRLKAISPEAYKKARKQHPVQGEDAHFFVLSPGLPKAASAGGYRLPYAPKGARSETSPEAPFQVVKITQRPSSRGNPLELRERYERFNRFIDANFQVLQTMSSRAGDLTRSGAELILSMTRRLARLYHELLPNCHDPSEELDALERNLLRGWASLGPEDSLPEDLRGLVLALDPKAPGGALHSLINWMHQNALALVNFMGMPVGSKTGTVDASPNLLNYTYLGSEPLGEVLAGNPALKGFLAILPRMPKVHGQLFFDENRVWLHSQLGWHSVEIFADLSDPDDGGMLRIRYQESGFDGSGKRLRMVDSFLKLIGMSTTIDGDDAFLNAVWDKDHGLDRSRSVAEAFPLIARFLHDAKDFDLWFGSEFGESRNMPRRLAGLYFGEGGWPFAGAGRSRFTALFSDYFKKKPLRDSLRATLDSELARLGLPPIPADLPFGQRIIDRHFTRPVLEARARQAFSLDDPPRDPGLAAALNAMEGDILSFSPIGFAGAFRAELAQQWLDDGSLLGVFALRDPSSGRIAFAKASIGDRSLGREGLRHALWASGAKFGEEEDWTPSQMERLQTLLRRPIPEGGKPFASGLPASPGSGFGPVTFDRRKAGKGFVLAVPYTTPDDLEAISNSAGVVTTGGGALSHAAITTRELGLPSVILPPARWTKEGLEVEFLGRGPVRVLADGIEVCGISASKRILREGDFAYIDGRTGLLSLQPGEDKPSPPRKALAAASPAPMPSDPALAERIRRSRPSVLRLDEVDSGLTEFVGGKAAKLGEMMSVVKGHVPGGIALTHWAFERFLAENGIREIDRKSVLAGRLDPEKGVGKEILDALGASRDSLWAVRSSAIQEDSDEAAFAGAAESYLFVKPEEILSKVVENWASFWLPRGILYRRQRGMDASGIVPATLIQEMVPAEKSGVIFTRNPVTSEDEIVINVVYGLGEGAVSGQADADSYTARKSDGEESALPLVARKRWQVSRAGLGPVPKPLRRKRVLSREQTRELSALATALERRFGRPMDIEFSIYEGKIAILQARPITTP